MSARFESFFEQSFNRISEKFNHFYQEIEPKVKKIETHLRSEFQKVEHYFERFRKPNINNKPVGLFFHLPPEQQRTLVKVGKAHLRVRGSFPVFQKFLQKLIEHEANQAATNDSEAAKSHTGLAKALIDAKHYVDDSCSTLQAIREFSSEIQNRRNELLLSERTPENANQLQKLDDMLAQLQQLTLPDELNAETIEDFSKTTWKLIAELRSEFDPQAPVKKELRNDVAETSIQAQEIMKKSSENQKLFDSLLVIISQLKTHLYELIKLKELLFKKDLSGFTNFDELHNYIASAQERQSLIKELELEVLILMDKNPSSLELKQETLVQYQKSVEELMAKHAPIIRAVEEEMNRAPQKIAAQEIVKAPVQQAPTAKQVSPVKEKSPVKVVIQPEPVPVVKVIPAPVVLDEISEFQQTKDALIDQRKAKFRSEINFILNYAQQSGIPELGSFKELTEEIILVRDRFYNSLSEKGQKCANQDEIAQWNSQLRTLEIVESQMYLQLEETINNACKTNQAIKSASKLAKEQIELVCQQGASFFNEFAISGDKECLKLKHQFQALTKNPKITLKGLQELIHTANTSMIQWHADKKITEETFSLWNITFETLNAKICISETLLLASASNKDIYIKILEMEKEKFVGYQNTYIAKKYDELIRKMVNAHKFDLEKSFINTLENHQQLWMNSLQSVEKERLFLSNILDAEEAYADSYTIAQKQIAIWQVNFQKNLSEPLQKMINDNHQILAKRKSMMRNSVHLELLTNALKNATKSIEDFINQAIETPFPDLIEANEITNPALAKSIYDHFIKKISDKIDQFKQTTKTIHADLLIEVSDSERSIKNLEVRIRKSKVVKDAQAEEEFDILTKRLFILKDLIFTLEHHDKRLTSITEVSSVARMSPAKLREYETKVFKCLMKAREEILEKAFKDPVCRIKFSELN